MPAGPESTGAPAPILTVLFGDPVWLAHLGGDFHAQESAGGISWAWMGAGRCWIVLPEGLPDTGLLVRLEAAPFWPLPDGHDLLDLEVQAGKRAMRGLAARPAGDPLWQSLPLEIPLREAEPPPGQASSLTLRLRKHPAICLEVGAAAGVLATLELDRSSVIQTREFVVPRGALGADRTLYLTPSCAIAPCELDPAQADSRRLSSRLFRMLVSPAA